MQQNLKSITLLGSSSGRNAGDAALIAGIMNAIDSSFGEKILYRIPTINPTYIRTQYQNRTESVGMMPWQGSLKLLGWPTYQAMKNSDLSLIFDAILFDRSLYNPLFNYMSSLWLMIPSLKKMGKRFGCYNVGLGPITSKAGERMLRDILNQMDFIFVRDTASLKVATDLGVSNPYLKVAPDAALTVSGSAPNRINEIFTSLGLRVGGEILGININKYLDTWVGPEFDNATSKKGDGKSRESMGKEAFLTAYAEGINKFLHEVKVPLLLVATQVHDLGISNELAKRIYKDFQCKVFGNINGYNHHDIRGVFERLSLLFGMRLHANILSAASCTPTIGLKYQAKVARFYEFLGIPEACMTFDNFSGEKIYHHLKWGWENRASLRGKLEKKIPEVQNLSLEPARFIKRLATANFDISKAWEF
jgi:polysaccharide pyruvyl transferase WcaK-like protein